jgi:hypothetical protein
VIDYREELDFKVSVVIFLVSNVGVNNKGRMLLSIEKLRMLILMSLTPKKLNSVAKKITKKQISHLQNVFYDDSSDDIDANDFREISLLIAYMCKLNYLKIVQEESKFIVIGDDISDFVKEICEGAPQYLDRNIQLIKIIAGKSESLITKALMGS